MTTSTIKNSMRNSLLSIKRILSGHLIRDQTSYCDGTYFKFPTATQILAQLVRCDRTLAHKFCVSAANNKLLILFNISPNKPASDQVPLNYGIKISDQTLMLTVLLVFMTSNTSDTWSEMMLRTVYRMGFLPSLSYNVVLNKLNLRPWYNRVDDKVIIGALPWISIKDQLINDENVAGVVSMNENFELLWLRRWVANGEHWNNSNVKFLQLQTQDIFETPSQDKLKLGVQFILSQPEGDSVYVHCKAGRTRSATLVCCYLMRRNNWNPEQAYELLASKRPQLALHKPQWVALRQFYQDNVAK